MEGENVADYNLRMIRLWETTKVCSKFCKTVKYEQELSDDDKSCLNQCGANAAMEKKNLEKFFFKASKNGAF